MNNEPKSPSPAPASSEAARPRVRYAHTNLVALDWRRLMQFYCEVFQCVPVSAERDNRGPQVEALTAVPGARVRGHHVRLPGHGENGPTLEIFSYEPKLDALPQVLNRPGFAHLAFEVDDVEKTRREIIARGGRDVGKLVTLDIANAGKLTLVYVYDPEGNILELQRWH
jgi:predicted enzyme related to lactoylglutathione lyase